VLPAMIGVIDLGGIALFALWVRWWPRACARRW
jgi:hypothetical protein